MQPIWFFHRDDLSSQDWISQVVNELLWSVWTRRGSNGSKTLIISENVEANRTLANLESDHNSLWGYINLSRRIFLRNNLMHCRYEHRLDLVNSRTRLEADTDIRFCLAQKDLGTKGSKIQNASKTVKAEDIICILLFSGYENNRVWVRVSSEYVTY